MEDIKLWRQKSYTLEVKTNTIREASVCDAWEAFFCWKMLKQH